MSICPLFGVSGNDSNLFQEKKLVPCLKVSMGDFNETRCVRNGRALVTKNDLDFNTLMAESSRRGSHNSSFSTKSHDMYLSRESSISSRFLSALRLDSDTSANEDIEGESDMDIMSLTSPGLSSPDSSPRSSLAYEPSFAGFEASTPEPAEVQQMRETPSRTSNETLVTEASDAATKVDEERLRKEEEDVGDEMTPRNVVRMEIRHEIPRIWVLEKPLPKMPVEIAPGILAV